MCEPPSSSSTCATSPATSGPSTQGMLSEHSDLGKLLRIHPVNGHTPPLVILDVTGCKCFGVHSPKQQYWQNCCLLWLCYTQVNVTPVLPQHAPHMCMFLSFLTKASCCLSSETSSLLLSGNVYTGLGHAPRVFPCHSSLLQVSRRGGLCHQMATTPMDIKRTSRHALDQNYDKNTSNSVIVEVTFRTLPGLFSLPIGLSIGWVFRKYPFHSKFLQVCPGSS